MSDYEQSLFNSYTWGGEREDIVNEINETIKRRGTPRFRYLSRSVEIKDKYSSQIQFNS
jgi:hypothetical protein